MRSQQAWLFLYFIIMGAAGGLLYDGLRALRRQIRHSTLAVTLEDGVFWALVAASCYGLFFVKNQGALRGYGFLGLVCGAILYFLLISPLCFRIWKGILKILFFPGKKLLQWRKAQKNR